MSDRSRRQSGIRAALRRRAVTRYPYQIMVALLGAAVIITGIVLLPLPGPGWLIIFIGLGIWSSEFRWAARLLRWVRARFAFWSRWTARWPPLARRLAAALLVIVAAGGAIAGYLAWQGTPAWVPDWVPLLD